MHNAWAFAFRNLGRNKRRSVATGAALVMGFTGVMVLGGYFLRIEKFLRTNAVYLQHLGHLTLYKEGGVDRVEARPLEYSFSKNEQETIARIAGQMPSVEFIARYVTGMGLAGNGCKTVPFVALGVEPEIEARILSHPVVLAATPELVVPLKGLPYPAYANVTGAVGLSSGLARLLGKEHIHQELGTASPRFSVPKCDAPDIARQLAADTNIQLASLTYSGSLSAVDGEVVNVFHTPLAATEDSTLLMRLDQLQNLFDTDLVTYEAFFLRDYRTATADARHLEQELRKAGVKVAVFTFDDERTSAYYAGSMALLKTIVKFISILLASVLSLTIVNAMTISILERTREMGTLRSLGFRRRQILGLFVRETLLLAAMSVAVGTATSMAIAKSINSANIRFHPPGVSEPLQLLITPTPMLWALLAASALVLSALATMVAVSRRTRRNIVLMLTDTTG